VTHPKQLEHLFTHVSVKVHYIVVTLQPLLPVRTALSHLTQLAFLKT